MKKIEKYKIVDIEYLFPDSLILVTDDILASIKKSSILTPIIMIGNKVVDGNRRVKACKALGLLEINSIQFEDSQCNPYLLFLELNINRPLNPFEAGWLSFNIDAQNQKEFCERSKIQYSPQMVEALHYVGKNYQQLENQLPLNIWRELAHIDNGLNKYGSFLSSVKGTVSEKRVIANLLRHCFRKKQLPDELLGDNGKAIISFLENIAKPRQNNALAKWNKALEDIDFPKGLNVKIDPTFEKPGISLNIHVLRKNLSRIDDTKKVLESLFTSVEEL